MARRRARRRVAGVALFGGLALAGWLGYLTVREEYLYQEAARAADREDFDAAARHLGSCLAFFPWRGGAIHFLAARVARRSENFGKAGEERKRCAALGWPAEQLRLEAALATFQQGDYDSEVEAFLLRHLTHGQADEDIMLEALVRGYTRAGNIPRAMKLAEVLVGLRPASPQARVLRGVLYEHHNQAARAEEDYRHALGIDRSHREARLRLAKLIHERDVAEAASLLESLRAEGAGGQEVDITLAECYTLLGRMGDAEALLAGLATLPSPDPAVLTELGKLALRSGRYEQARAWLSRSIAVAPEQYEPHHHLFLCWQALGKEEEARGEEKILRRMAADRALLLKLGVESVKGPPDQDRDFRMAELFLRQGEEGKGLTVLQQMLFANPRNANAHRLLADHYERTGRPVRAEFHRRFVETGGTVP